METRTCTALLAGLLIGAAATLAAAQPRTWIFFKDKGCQSQQTLQQAFSDEEARLLPQTRARLLKVRAASCLLTETDLPVYSGYLQEIERLIGARPHAVCRAVNAASFALDAAQIAAVQHLPFVREVRPVLRFRRDPEPASGAPGKVEGRLIQDSLFYGSSYEQNLLENFPPAHAAGYTGQGVFVGSLDAGWNNLGHHCFDSLEIVATWDFVNGDSSVANDPGQLGDGSHGTKTLSCYAGYDPHNFIGTAYGVHVALAKTECTSYELPIEEDNWAAGIEWLDSLGCVIVTSSVSYNIFDGQDTIYYYMRDGNTTVITNAADNAVARGIVVLNSVSNHGLDAYPYNKMNVPADGDSVLGIGAVNSDSSRAVTSSMGPTYDGRIKPDLMALGSNVYVASPYNDSTYLMGSGTSFSTPITAGACALLLQADPALTPMQVQAFLKATGDQAANPDTLRGWGIYNVWLTIQNVLAAAPTTPKPSLPQEFRIIGIYPNPFNPEACLVFDLPAAGDVHLGVYDVLGRQVASLAQNNLPAGRCTLIWNGTDFSSGVYLFRLKSAWGVRTGKAVMTK